MKKFFGKLFKLESRKHRRYKILDNVLLVFDPNTSYGEQVFDISLGGVSFSYIDEGKQLGDVFEIDLVAEDVFQLGKTKVKVISDEVIAELPNESAVVRRVGGRFLNLTPVQEFDLRKFIETYGSKTLEDAE